MGNIRIGTRASKLAVWQAKQVQALLQKINISSSIIKIKSSGDKDLSKPVYELGVTGVFTKEIDIALLNNEIDIAVHSMKDVPTILPEGIIQAAVLKRANNSDIIVLKDTEEFFGLKEATIATGSLRRKAMWLNRFPTHTVHDPAVLVPGPAVLVLRCMWGNWLTGAGYVCLVFKILPGL